MYRVRQAPLTSHHLTGVLKYTHAVVEKAGPKNNTHTLSDLRDGTEHAWEGKGVNIRKHMVIRVAVADHIVALSCTILICALGSPRALNVMQT